MSYSIPTELRDLGKTVQKIGIPISVANQENQNQTTTTSTNLNPRKFIGLDFWRWDLSSAEHKALAKKKEGQCCFNHKIGLPYRDGHYSPIFHWQQDVFNAYEQHKYNWILKATGLGVTEFTLRYILWKCTRGNEWSLGWCCIVTGPNEDLAKELIDRSKKMIQESYPLTSVTNQMLIINNVRVRAFPSNHLDAMRSLVNVKFIFLDEADFFRKSDQQDTRDTSERYIAKSNPQILLVSTPNAPGGLMERIENEKEDACLYHRMKLPYTVGVGTMYSQEQINQNMQSPSFEREYNLRYLGSIGNVFHIQDVEYAVNTLGNGYNPYNTEITTDPLITRSMGCDPGFGSSMFGIVIQQWVNGYAEIVYADHIERGSMTECLNQVLSLAQRHHVFKIYVDASASGFIADLKKTYGEQRNYADIIKENPKVVDAWIVNDEPRVVPIAFRDRHEGMLRNVELLLQKKLLRIHTSFDKLIIALRTATSKGDKYDLDKEHTSHDDILDALQLALLNLYLKP